eukprot:30817-Pelagococcus_subviridis.AAC.4
MFLSRRVRRLRRVQVDRARVATKSNPPPTRRPLSGRSRLASRRASARGTFATFHHSREKARLRKGLAADRSPYHP